MLTCRYIYLSVSVCVVTDIITYEMTHICIRSNSWQLFWPFITYSKFYLCTTEYISLYIHINYVHTYVHLSSYLHIIFHIYTSYISTSLKWVAFWIRTILIVDFSPTPPSIQLAISFNIFTGWKFEFRVARINLNTGGARRRWTQSSVSSSGSSLSFASWSTLEATGFNVDTHTWNVILAARILQHTHAHTHHTLGHTHTHAHNHAHTHTHTRISTCT